MKRRDILKGAVALLSSAGIIGSSAKSKGSKPIDDRPISSKKEKYQEPQEEYQPFGHALKRDMQLDNVDASFFCDDVLERGTVVCHQDREDTILPVCVSKPKHGIIKAPMGISLNDVDMLIGIKKKLHKAVKLMY